MQAVTTLSDGDITAVLLCSFIVFFQNIGFAALENGNVRAKNARAILLKNCIDKLVGGLCYWAVGFAFAYGSSSNGFIGTSHFFLSQLNGPVAALWVLSATFLMTATTIVSGCLAERAQFEAYLAYTPLMAVLVYPLVVHWVTQGWLTTFATHCTYLDFAGGSMVHLVGGVAGLVAAWQVGPRLGRFDGAIVKPIPGHNVESTVLGTLMLWFGWYGFNIGPAYLRGDARGTVAARAAVNTTICGCAGALTALLLAWLRTRTYEVRTCCNGVLGGMVAITALAPFVDPWAAFVLGCIAGGVYIGCSRALLCLRIDDPLDASAVHAGCSLVGLLGVGVFGEPTYIAQNHEGYDRVCGGFFFASPARRGGEQLGVQLLGIITISAFTAACSLALFGTLRYFNKLRVDTATEIAGLDFVDHGGSAYPDFLLRVEAQD